MSAGIRLLGLDAIVGDSTFQVADSAGAIAIGGLRPGRYRIVALAVNYVLHRDTLFVHEGIDTIRVAMKRGPALCSVRVGP